MRKHKLILAVLLVLVVFATVASASGALDETWWEWMVRKLTEWSSGWWGY